MRKIGINLGARTDLSTEAYIRTIRELGFETVFTMSPAVKEDPSIPKLVEAAGLCFDTLHAPFGHINDIWYAEDNGMYRELTDCVDACAQVGAPIAVVHLSAGMQPPPPTDIGRGRFSELVSYAMGKGIRIAFENQRMLGNIAWAFEEFQDAENVGFCWDCGHEACFTPGRQYMPLFGSRLICTHIHDNSKQFNADLHQLPFDGGIDFDTVASQIRGSGFDGPLMLEVNGRSELYSGFTAEAFLQRAAQAVKRLRRMTDGE